MNDLVYRIAITKIPGIGDVLAKNLISYCGGIKEVFKQKKHKLMLIPGIGEKAATAISQFKQFDLAEREAAFIDKHQIKPFFYLDKDYPTRLAGIQDAPVMLYALGNMNVNAPRIAAIVGTRKCTEYGKHITEEIVACLKSTGVTIISGLALGIDVSAHRQAVKLKMETVGVMATGLDKVYPHQHKGIAKAMIENGGLLTEFTSGTIPDRENFPKRNRIVAGMCDVLIVVETGIKGGAMITAEIANTYNKEIIAVPGRITDDMSFGCNALVKLNKASTINVPEDILTLMGWEPQTQNKKQKIKQIGLLLSEQEVKVIELIKARNKIGIDDLAYTTQMSAASLSLLLLDLEFKGIIRQLPGKVFELV
ncbi:MAG: DNA-processing protein DprA [Bacteroidia bacterium]|jgi:DNA processing protein|nr:DNA-processing protein DprA [Bacteroidia bacterium]